jgi:diketogulonate reductase-like aldo/keto reductase
MTFIAFGTYKLNYDEAYNITLQALQNNYRYIDTAQLYHNEKAVGKAIKDSGIQRENCISRIQLFRDYLHYHLKCSKAYMHQRMRSKVTDFLKILNRAKPDPSDQKEKKLASGRTFKR